MNNLFEKLLYPIHGLFVKCWYFFQKCIYNLKCVIGHLCDILAQKC